MLMNVRQMTVDVIILVRIAQVHLNANVGVAMCLEMTRNRVQVRFIIYRLIGFVLFIVFCVLCLFCVFEVL